MGLTGDKEEVNGQACSWSFGNRGFWSLLPSIHLANVCSLANKMDELFFLNSINSDFYWSARSFTETWLGEHTPESALLMLEFQLLLADWSAELSGKKIGGGICFYINKGWCTFFIECKNPFIHRGSSPSFVLANVYIPPQTCTSETQKAAHWANERCGKTPRLLFIRILRVQTSPINFLNTDRISSVQSETKNTQVRCYKGFKKHNSYHIVNRATLRHSDHCLLSLLLTYR